MPPTRAALSTGEAPGKAKKAAGLTTGKESQVMDKAEESVVKDKAPAAKAITRSAADKAEASKGSIAATKAVHAGPDRSRTRTAAAAKWPKSATMAKRAFIRTPKRPATAAVGQAKTAGAKASAASKLLDLKARSAPMAATILARANKNMQIKPFPEDGLREKAFRYSI